MEYAIPAQHASTALKQVRHVLDEGDLRLFLPSEVRYVAPETHLLSTSLDRPQGVVYIGMSPGRDIMNNSAEVFERFEPLMRALDGRPHWGKHFSLTRDDLKRMYPTTHDTFVQTRRRFDPNGVFLNSRLLPLFE
jgi:L-gulonolactone oxidase